MRARLALWLAVATLLFPVLGWSRVGGGPPRPGSHGPTAPSESGSGLKDFDESRWKPQGVSTITPRPRGWLRNFYGDNLPLSLTVTAILWLLSAGLKRGASESTPLYRSRP